jgi:hypothetical protein
VKLNRTRELWKATSPSGRWYYEIERQAQEDLATLFAENARLTAQLAEREGQEPVAWGSSDPTRLNQLMSAAQYKSALPKNRAYFDVPLYARFHAAEGKSHDA